MSLISFSTSSTDQDYQQKKLQYIADVNSSRKGSYSVTTYYSGGVKNLEQFTGNIYKSPIEQDQSIPWQCRLTAETNSGNVVSVQANSGDLQLDLRCPEPNLMSVIDFDSRFFISDLLITNSQYLTGRNFSVYNSTGDTYTVNTDRKLFVASSVVPASMQRYLSAYLGQRYAKTLGYTSTQESMIVFSEKDKTYQNGASVLLVYCGGSPRTVISDEKITKCNVGFFYRLEYSEFESNRVNYT